MELRVRFFLLLMTIYVLSTSPVLAASSVTITPTGGGGFTIQGDSMKGVQALEITIGFDPSALATPAVRWGSLVSGAFSIANTPTPGTLKIAIAAPTNPLPDNSGTIATVVFAAMKGGCGITTISANVVESNSAYRPALTTLLPGAACAADVDTGIGTGTVNTAVGSGAGGTVAGTGKENSPAGIGTGNSVNTVTTGTTVVASGTGTGGGGSTGLGTISFPVDFPQKSEASPAEPKKAAAPLPAEPVETAEITTQQLTPSPQEKSVEIVEPVTVKRTVYGGVLERFRVYQGEKTAEIMTALFMKEVAPSIQQEPLVAVSDGTSLVRVHVDGSAVKGASTNFALTGATMVSLKNEGETGNWVLDVLPEANSLKAVVTVLSTGSMIEFPLTVVPPAAGVSANKTDFDTFLKDSGAKVPKHDLNGDARHDYQDDYIYTAHYLIKSAAVAKGAR